MIIFLVFIQLLISQEIEFKVRDNSLYELGYKQGLEVELDSVRFFNSSLGIDTTLKYSKIIDLTDILVTNSVNENKDEPFQINLTNDYLKINSNSIIKSIRVFDFLGREVINKNVNKNQLVENQTFDDRFYFIQITSENGNYNYKILKSNDNSSTSILLNNISWEVTLYKYAFKPKTLEYITLPTKIEEELIRKRIRIEYSFTADSVTYGHYYRAFNQKSSYDDFKDFKDNTVLYDTISLDGLYVYDYKFECNSYLLKREYNSFTKKLNRGRHIYYIDSLYKLTHIAFGFTDFPRMWENETELFELKLKTPLDINDLFNGNKTKISYYLVDEQAIWKYKYMWEFTYTINSYEIRGINKNENSSIHGPINITLID